MPDLADWPRIALENHGRLAAATTLIAGLSLSELRATARRQSLDVALQYLARCGTPLPEPPDPKAPIILSGHQPAPFHVGVWLKNFAAVGLAHRVAGVPLHVLADNDNCRECVVGVPTGRPDAPLVAFVPLDRGADDVPYEERDVVDEEVFRRFGDTVVERMSAYPFRPLIEETWREVVRAERFTSNLGERISHGRRALERRFSAIAAEAPLSRLEETPAFRRLVAELMTRAREFRAIHNAAIADFRHRHGVRSRRHPAPDLEAIDDWIETPFWLWTPTSPRRRRAFARRRSDRLELRAGDDRIAQIAIGCPDPIARVAEALGDEMGDWKLRSRALTTTLYLRLLVADLFVHGVGGGVYDEVTDEIVRGFFGIEAPAFVVFSATALLPVAPPDPAPEIAAIGQQLRDVRWNPDRRLADPLREQGPIADWIERKFALIAETPRGRSERRARFRELREINSRLRPYVGAVERRLEGQLEEARHRQAAAVTLGSREFAYWLHPRSTLEPLIGPLVEFRPSALAASQ